MNNGGQKRSGILLVDDDRELLDLLAFVVKQAGMVPIIATEPDAALELFEKEDPILAVLDLNNLRPWDGFELLANLRQRSTSLTIIVLTARNSDDDKVRALEMGADDYVVKPFSHRELVARIRAHARRSEQERDLVALPAVIEVGAVRLDPAERILSFEGQELRLTATECKLLHFLMRNSNAVVPTSTVAKQIWGYDDAPAREVVRVTVHRLRRKLGDGGPHRRLIHTIPGVGLKFQPDLLVTRESEPTL